jgi:hypothetical protein
MIEARLPKQFMPYRTNDLIRLGRDYDGGYLIRASDVEKTKLLLSFGINDDWSFEQDFFNRRNVPITAYDGSISYGKIVRKFISGVFTPYKLKSLIHRTKNIFSYHNFFASNRVHVSKFVGSKDSGRTISISRILEEIKNLDVIRAHGITSVFLKMDIEGAEYEILPTLLNHKSLFSGMAIEFHNCHERLSEIEAFLKMIDLPLVHLHPNNWCSLDSQGRPNVIEATLSSGLVSDDRGISSEALKLDMPNTPRRPDMKLIFADY